jgi:hypothetical protein
MFEIKETKINNVINQLSIVNEKIKILTIENLFKKNIIISLSIVLILSLLCLIYALFFHSISDH